MRVLRFSILLLFLIPVGVTYSQNAKCHRSTEGKDFWFGFLEGRNNNGNVHYIEVAVTAREATNFTVYIGKSATPYYVNSVADNSSVQFKINPLSLAEAT